MKRIEKVKVIELSKIDELLEEYKEYKNRGEKFSEFIEVSKCLDNNEAIFDWNLVEADNLIIMKEDKYGNANENKNINRRLKGGYKKNGKEKYRNSKRIA